MGPCSKYDNQWPENEEAMDMEHIRPEDYVTLDELDDISDELRYIGTSTSLTKRRKRST